MIEQGEQLLCPDINSLEIRGQANDGLSIEIAVIACKSTTKFECFDETELINHSFFFLPLHNVIDFLQVDDDEYPLNQYYLDQNNFLKIDGKLAQEIDLFYHKTELLID